MIQAASSATRPSYFGERSVIRRVMGERVVAFSGARSLLMQAAHPLAVAGLLAHSDSLEAPYERLARTAQVMNAITFGSRAEADRLTARVRAMHQRVRGALPEAVGIYPAGTPYRADDPELLMWILYTLIDSASLFYTVYVGGLSRLQRRALWEDYKVVGELFGLGLEQMPDTLEELDDYGREMFEGERLCVGDWARRRARQIVLEPPVPVRLRPVLETVNFVTIALLPDEIRRQYGFSPLVPPLARKALVRGGALYVRGALPLLPDAVRHVPSARSSGKDARAA
ncbi:MAG TPA: oxygenase MpaB family protein [Solirubrobacteraceae bacterium]|nr:oxygenase MpaB family protein [Solirubrobacteraceae bacterium]